jgi:hypothetical protein
MSTLIETSGAPEFPVGRMATDQAIPRWIQPDWVDEAEMRRLKHRFRGGKCCAKSWPELDASCGAFRLVAMECQVGAAQWSASSSWDHFRFAHQLAAESSHEETVQPR